MKNNSKTFREVSKRKMIEQGLNVVIWAISTAISIWTATSSSARS